MTFLDRLYRWLTAEPSDRVSANWLREQARTAAIRGVDLPRWRLPKERA